MSSKSTNQFDKISAKEFSNMMEVYKNVVKIEKPLEMTLAILDGI